MQRQICVYRSQRVPAGQEPCKDEKGCSLFYEVVMKKSLKLTNLSNAEKSSIRGGTDGSSIPCGCGCFYAGNGGSSSNDNGAANVKKGIFSAPPTNS